MLCDLISAQAAVLERNVSPQVAAHYKRASVAGIAALGRLARRRIPELGEDQAFRLAGSIVMMTGALWPHTQPSAALLAAYEADPALRRHAAGLHRDPPRGGPGVDRRHPGAAGPLAVSRALAHPSDRRLRWPKIIGATAVAD